MKKFDIFKYNTDNSLGFPVILKFYFRYTGEEIGFIEIYRNGKCYTDMFGSGTNIKHIKKMLKIADRERIIRIIKTKITWKKND